MKPGWKTKLMSELFDITSSKRVFKADWKSEGVPFYRAREIVKLAENGTVNNELFISEEMYNEYSSKYGIPQAGDIMITGVGTLGICYLVKQDDKFYFKDGNIIWLKKKSEVNSRFVEYAYKSDYLRKQVTDNSMGATVGTYTIIRAKNTKIPIPPLSEQKRIVKILDKAFAAIDQAKANAKKNLQNSRELFESYLNKVFANPGEDWEEKKLGEVCRNVEYGTSSKSQKTGKIPVLRMGNIQDGKFVWDNLVYSNDDKEIGKYLLDYNDVLFNRTNSPELVGKTAIYKNEQPAIFAGYLIRININKQKLDADYLNFFMNSCSVRNYGFSVMTSSVNQANINGTKLKQYSIPVPSLNVQKQIVKKLLSLSNETKKLEAIYQQKLADLDELKKSILQKAFEGQL